MFQLIKFVPFLLLLFVTGCNTTGQPDRVVRIDEIQTKLVPKIPATQITFSLEPFKSFPGNFADLLADQIVIKAKSKNISITRSVRISTSHQIDGQISALGGDNGTVILYAFDIKDSINCHNPIGCRVFRINGQETAGGTSGDPWQSANNGTAQHISDKVISELSAWISRAPQETKS